MSGVDDDLSGLESLPMWSIPLPACLARLRARDAATGPSVGADRRGGIALIGALLLVPLTGLVGLAVDSMILFSVESQLQRALDAAGLAAGRAISEDEIASEATAFFKSNLGNADGFAEVGPVAVAYAPDAEQLNLSVSARVPSYFMRVLGTDDTEIRLESVIDLAVRQMELVLVMDNTGSMRSGGMINAMKDSARDLVNIIYGGRETNPNLWVGLVPYVASVNIGAGRSGWLESDDQVFGVTVTTGNGKKAKTKIVDPFAPTSWKGCVMARSAPLDENDDPPSLAPFSSYLYLADSDNIWPPIDDRNSAQNNGTGPNLGCGPAITSLRQSRSEIHAAIEEMQPWHRGGTTGNLGLVWGWRVISPRWRGLWGGATPAELPLDYDVIDSDKVVVLLTDGNNQFYDHSPSGPSGSDFTAYGRLHDFGYGSLSAGRDEINARMSRICRAMKDEGIILYTITFGPAPNAATQGLYRSCASTPSQYFHSPGNNELAGAFRAIGRQLATLRLAR